MTKLTYHIYTSVHELSEAWDELRQDEFLNLSYLIAQENALPENMDVFYIAIYDQNKIIGKAIVQRVKVRGDEVYRNKSKLVKAELLNLLNVNVLCLGNLKLTGEHSFVYNKNYDRNQILLNLKNAFNEIRKISKNEKIPIQLMGVKDFYAESLTHVQDVFNDYQSFSVQPNMVLSLKMDWNSFNDYLDAMRTKYRTRAKRAFKKSIDLSFRELSLEEIRNQNSLIYGLYLNVLQNADFSLYQLPENFFIEMKKEMPEKFKFFGGFLNNEMVCFYSIIENRKQLEAGFLGYHTVLQKEHQLYLNILYQIVSYGIHHDFENIDFSRTAMEIKSSIGAEPIETYGLLKHTHPLMNKVLGSIFTKFYKPEDWIQREPFKA